MNVSSVKNLNGETFSAVQDADLTTVVQSNSGSWDRISALSGYSANGWKVKLKPGPTVIASSMKITASGVPTFTGHLTVSADTKKWVSIANGSIFLSNDQFSYSAQRIRTNDIEKWNNTTSVLQTNSSNWNEISSYQNASGTYLTAVNIPESADWNDTTDVVQSNSASWGAGSTPTYDYTDNNLISAIDTSGLYASSAGTANALTLGGRLGADVYAATGHPSQDFHLMVLNPQQTPFGNTSGIYGPLLYAQGACMTYGSSSYGSQYFGGFIKGNEWYVSNATAGQALRGETHQSRGVHISGATTAGTRFDLSVNCVSGKNSTGDYNWKLERGCVSGKGINGEWRYGPAEDTALRTASALEYNAVDEISGIAGSAIAQYGAEKQWLVHDDTLVHAANSAQYALGVNLSAVAQLMGVDETVLWSGTIGSQGDTCVLSENLTNFNKLNFVIDEQNGSITQHDCVLNVNGASQWPTYIYPIYSRTNGDGAIINYLWSFSFNAANSGSISKSVIRTNGSTTSTNNAKIIKVVGIGRKQ